MECICQNSLGENLTYSYTVVGVVAPTLNRRPSQIHQHLSMFTSPTTGILVRCWCTLYETVPTAKCQWTYVCCWRQPPLNFWCFRRQGVWIQGKHNSAFQQHASSDPIVASSAFSRPQFRSVHQIAHLLHHQWHYEGRPIVRLMLTTTGGPYKGQQVTLTWFNNAYLCHQVFV